MNQTGNRNSILGWVKNLKRNTLLNESLDEINDDLSASESRSPSRSSFQSGSFIHHPQAAPFPASPTKEKSIPQPNSGMGSASEFLRPLLSHKSRSTNNVNNSRSDSISRSISNHDNSVGLRQRRDSFLQNNPLVDENSKYFGVPLADAINQAAAKISILGSESSNISDDDVLHYGRIPIVVAKCGVYLKKNGLNVEGIFRVGGSSKRIKELQIIFNSPPEFGKKLNWDGYTVHDAASVLRRYLNALPEPLIPLDLYEEFRDPLRSRPRIIKYLKYKANNSQKATRKNTVSVAPVALADQTYSSGKTTEATSLVNLQQDENKANTASTADTTMTQQSLLVIGTPDQEFLSSGSTSETRPKSYKSLTRDMHKAIDEYKQLLDELPCLSKQLLFYILDLLAMVQSLAEENLMSSRNLAAIFQPSILLHPSHDMDPEEYALSQSVVEFLILYSYKLLPNSDTRPESSSSASVESAHPLESKPPTRIPSRRQHSKSLSTPNHDLDFIGYRSAVKPMRSFALSDTEHDFVSASSEDEDFFDRQLQNNWNMLTVLQQSQKDDSNQLLEPGAEVDTPRDVPLVVLDKTS